MTNTKTFQIEKQGKLTEKTITLTQAISIQLTLQYCLETLEQNCQCGSCDPCNAGQTDILQAIRTMDDVINRGK